jgi:hypothetical protein
MFERTPSVIQTTVASGEGLKTAPQVLVGLLQTNRVMPARWACYQKFHVDLCSMARIYQLERMLQSE